MDRLTPITGNAVTINQHTNHYKQVNKIHTNNSLFYSQIILVENLKKHITYLNCILFQIMKKVITGIQLNTYRFPTP